MVKLNCARLTGGLCHYRTGRLGRAGLALALVAALSSGVTAQESYDRDLGPGWQHLTAQRQGSELRLFVNGRLAAKSAPFDPKNYDLTVDRPLKIGFGEHDFFTGRIRQVRVYRRALSEREVAVLQATDRP